MYLQAATGVSAVTGGVHAAKAAEGSLPPLLAWQWAVEI